MISTKNLPSSEKGLPKTITAGNHVVKVNSIYVDETPSRWNEGAFNIIVNVETKPIEGFEGFWIDKDNESKGKHLGQVGRVKANRYGFSDFDNGTIKRDKTQEFLKFMRNLCISTNCMDWFNSIDDKKYNTIQDLVDGFNNDKPYADKYINCIVSGKEYQSRGGYINQELFFGNPSKEGLIMESIEENPSKLQKFDEEKHLIKLVQKEEFEQLDNVAGVSADLDLEF
jgi:hypothetical protein